MTLEERAHLAHIQVLGVNPTAKQMNKQTEVQFNPRLSATAQRDTLRLIGRLMSDIFLLFVPLCFPHPLNSYLATAQ